MDPAALHRSAESYRNQVCGRGRCVGGWYRRWDFVSIGSSLCARTLLISFRWHCEVPNGTLKALKIFTKSPVYAVVFTHIRFCSAHTRFQRVVGYGCSWSAGSDSSRRWPLRSGEHSAGRQQGQHRTNVLCQRRGTPKQLLPRLLRVIRQPLGESHLWERARMRAGVGPQQWGDCVWPETQ